MRKHHNNRKGSMKILRFVVLAFALLCGVVRAQTNMLFGSPEAVEKHSIQSGRIFTVGVIQVLNGRPIEIGNDGWNTNFTSKSSMYRHFHSNLTVIAQKAITGNFGQDRDQPFRMYAQYYRMVNGPGVPYRPVYYYVAFTEFSLVKTGSTYSLPQDLTSFPMELPSDYVVYTMPKYAWAQVDTVSSNGYRVRTVDSENPQEGFDLSRSLILIPTQHAVSSDSFKTTVRVVTSQNTFSVFDENGNLRPEMPAEVGIGIQELAASGKSLIPASLSLQIKNGEPGRIYQIQSSPTLGGSWTDLPSGKVIKLPAYENPVYTSMDGVQKFYRAIPVDGVPIPK